MATLFFMLLHGDPPPCTVRRTTTGAVAMLTQGTQPLMSPTGILAVPGDGGYVRFEGGGDTVTVSRSGRILLDTPPLRRERACRVAQWTVEMYFNSN